MTGKVLEFHGAVERSTIAVTRRAVARARRNQKRPSQSVPLDPRHASPDSCVVAATLDKSTGAFLLFVENVPIVRCKRCRGGLNEGVGVYSRGGIRAFCATLEDTRDPFCVHSVKSNFAPHRAPPCHCFNRSLVISLARRWKFYFRFTALTPVNRYRQRGTMESRRRVSCRQPKLRVP